MALGSHLYKEIIIVSAVRNHPVNSLTNCSLKLIPYIEFIHKLATNGNELKPDNDSTSKIGQSKIVVSFHHKTNKQFTETIEKDLIDFNYTLLFLHTVYPILSKIAMPFSPVNPKTS